MVDEDLRDGRPTKRKRKPRPTQKARCRAHTQAGEPCRAWAIVGGTVCSKHGGSAPQVKRKAQERLLASVDWLIVELLKIARSSNNEGVKLQAIRDALDRAGMGAKQIIGLDLQTTWDASFDGVVWAQGEREESEELAALRTEIVTLRAVAAGRARPELRAREVAGEVLEGRVVEPGEPGYGPLGGP